MVGLPRLFVTVLMTSPQFLMRIGVAVILAQVTHWKPEREHQPANAERSRLVDTFA